MANITSSGSSLTRHIVLDSIYADFGFNLPKAKQMMEKKPASTEYEQFRAGLKAFFRIAREWELNPDQSRKLLGAPSLDAFLKWKSGKISHDAVSIDLLDRLSYILGIYKDLKIMHSPENQKLFLTNDTQLARFNFSSPIEYMLTGHLVALADVRKYLDDQRH